MLWWIVGGLGAGAAVFFGWLFREMCREVNELYEKDV